MFADKKGVSLLGSIDAAPELSPDGLAAALRGDKRWVHERLDTNVELDIMSFGGRIYVTARDPDEELMVLLEFTPDRQRHVLCYVGSSKPPRH